MRIAIIAPEGLPIPPSRGGSVQIYLNELTKSLAAHSNYEIVLLCPGDSSKSRISQSDSQSGIRHITYPLKQGKNPQQLLYWDWVYQEVGKMKPDIIQVDNRPKLASRLQRLYPGTPVILNLHSLTFLGPMHIPHAKARDSLRRLHVVVNSEYIRKTLQQRFGLATEDWDVHVIYPGVNLSKWRTESTHPHDKSQKLEVLFVGRVIHQKGVHVLIRAIKKMKQNGVPVRLTIVGQTHPWERKYYAALRKSSLGLPVVWKGFVSPYKVPSLVKKAHVVVVPSQSKEAFGLINIEAMAAGVPVIASLVGGIPEVVDKSCGFLVRNPSSVESFARYLTRLSESESLRQKLSQGAKERASQFTWERAARQFIRLYSELHTE